MPRTRTIVAGVDTHADTHHAAVLDSHGRLLDHRAFPATGPGYRQLLAWMRQHGRVARVGIEGTGSYGAGLSRYLRGEAVAVIEVNQPDRRTRRQRGKSDPIDAEAAARAVLAGTATAVPKDRTGIVEAIRVLRVARSGAVKARTAALNQLKDLVTTAPEDLRTALRTVTLRHKAKTCAQLQPDTTRLADPTEATTAALHAVGTRVQALTDEITQADRRLRTLVAQAAPRTTLYWACPPNTPASCWSPPATTPNGSVPRPRSPPCARPAPSRPAAARPTDTDSTPAATAPPTTPCT
jgi:transposase